MKVWRPRLECVDTMVTDVEFVKGEHVLVSSGTQEFWVQLLAFVKQKEFLGLVCSRTHRLYGSILALKQEHILGYAY